MKLIVSQAAESDLARVHAFLAEKNPAAADRAVAAVIAGIQSIAPFPQRGRRSGKPGIRELLVPFSGRAYVLRYAYSEERDEAVVLRVWHSRETRK